MEVKLKNTGTIISISDKQMFGTGSGKLTFRIETDDKYNKVWEFELFKSAAYVEHLDNFTKYNSVGDNVEVEFDIKTNHYTDNGKDAVYTSLGAWKVNKLDEAIPTFSEATTEGNTALNSVKEPEDLPF